MKHVWVQVSAYISTTNVLREAFECEHCGQIRLGDTLPEAPMYWHGPYNVWNNLDDCDEDSIERFEEGKRRSAVGAGFEHLGAFIGDRKTGFLFDGRHPYRVGRPVKDA